MSDATENFQGFPFVDMEQLKADAKRLQEDLLKYDAFEMITALMFLDLWTPARMQNGSERRGLAPFVTYVALLYLKRPYNVGTGQRLNAQILTEAKEQIESIFFRYQMSIRERWGTSSGDELTDRINEVRIHTFGYELQVGPSGYDHHLRDELYALFQPHNAWLLQHCGFTIEDACALVRTIISLIEEY